MEPDDYRDFIRREVEAFLQKAHEATKRKYFPDLITADWLMEKHPELSPEDAELYRQFCASQTIDFMGCYGNGEIMWPRWQALQAEIAAL